MTIGQRICNRRQELGLTQEELALKMGYKSRNAIYQFEKADNMKISLVSKFSEALSCPVSYLMGWEDETEVNEVELEIIEKKKEEERQAKLLMTYYAKLNPEQQESVLNLIKNMV